MAPQSFLLIHEVGASGPHTLHRNGNLAREASQTSHRIPNCDVRLAAARAKLTQLWYTNCTARRPAPCESRPTNACRSLPLDHGKLVQTTGKAPLGYFAILPDIVQ